mmetsp:Transcript_36111/g.90870  ORF Transcript_36111/g.90870 Transcript_36111/m.90870 type:complete len:582 (-) Transcript_36111:76-1821(-)
MSRIGRTSYLVTISVFVTELLTAECDADGLASRNIRGTTASRQAHHLGTDVYYLTGMADRFEGFAARSKPTVDSNHLTEQSRLQTAIMNAASAKDKMLLQSTAMMDEASRLEANAAYDEMLGFALQLKEASGAQGGAALCGSFMCGEHAVCEELASGNGHCRCQEGYQGDGFVCNPPTRFTEQPLLGTAMAKVPGSQVADLHITTLRGDQVALVYRDITKSHAGYLMLGQAGPLAMTWGSPVQFSDRAQAFSPVVVELQDGSGLAIAFRDQNRDGTGILVGASLMAESSNETSRGVTLSPQRAFARHQAQGMALLPLEGSRVVLLFAEHSGLGQQEVGNLAYGSAVVAKINSDSGLAPDIFGKHRFVTGPVARLSATSLSPSSFVVAYRRGESDPAAPRTEASCTFVQVKGAELVFKTAPVSLEPDRSQIWARSVAPVAEDTFVYTYHSGNEKATKQAVLRVDPATQQVVLLRQPEVISKGFTPYVGSLSSASVHVAPQEPASGGPLVMTYFSDGDSTKAAARYCRFNSGGSPVGCRAVEWSSHELVSVSGTPMQDGRVVFAFTNAKGQPYYQMVGLEEPL